MTISVKNVSKRYGDHIILKDISFEMTEGKVIVLMGTNGSGKTTLLNILSGFIVPDQGDVLLDGESINKLKPYQRCLKGIGRSFQDLRLISSLTVMENVLLAFPNQKGERWWNTLFPSKAVREELNSNREKAEQILRQCFITEVAESKAGEISFGQQKLLNLACSLASGTPFLLLDEPVAGVNPAFREKLSEVIKELKCKGKGMLIVEHSGDFIDAVADEIIFLSEGGLKRYRTYNDFRNDKGVLEAYL